MSGKTLRRVAIGAVMLLGFGAAGLVCQRVGERGRYVSAYSTYGAGPDGTRGLFLLSDELGARPARWAEDLGRLPEGGMLVALGSCDQLMRREVGRIERENLRAWVERGGVLVVAGVPSYLTRSDFGVEIVADPEQCRPSEGLIGMLSRAEARERDRDRKQVPVERDDGPELEDLPDALASDPSGTYETITAEEAIEEARLAVPSAAPLLGIAPVGMRRALRLEVDPQARADTLLRLDGPNGRPVGVRVDIGRGAVIALASGSAFTNQDLRESGGGVLFARLVRAHGGPVLFDEYHLGVGQRRSMMRYLRQAGAGALFVQVLLLVGFALWRVGARFGGTRIDPPAEPAGTVSYVDGVATLYEKSRDPSGAARILVRRALSRIAAHHHLGSNDPARMIELLEQRGRTGALDAVRALAALLDDDKRGLTKIVEEVDALVARAQATLGLSRDS